MDGKPEVGICAGNIELIDAEGNLFPEKRQRRDVPFRRLDFDDMFLERKPYPPAPTLMIRREALDTVGGFDPGIRLEDLYIDPEARGMGAGKAMLKYIAKIAVENDCGRFEWSVLDWNTPAIKVYDSIGAKPQSEWIRYRLTGDALLGLASS